MPIRTGDLSSSVAPSTLISDGKRLRAVWTPSSLSGDPTPHHITRTLGTKNGHPTWLLYCGNPDVEGLTVPPPFVYLDDRSCHEVLASGVLTKEDLKNWWPYDFDAFGKVKVGRPNRGRPAWTDESETVHATGPVRSAGKTKSTTYTFVGGPMAAVPTSSSTGTAFPINEKAREEPSVFPLNGRIPFTPPTKYTGYKAGPTDGTAMPLGMAQKAVQGSPYGEVPAARFRTNPRPRGGDLSALVGTKRKGRGPSEMESPQKKVQMEEEEEEE